MTLPASMAICVFTVFLLAATSTRAQAQAAPFPGCADADPVATDSAALGRQLGPECNQVESVRLWNDAGNHEYGYNNHQVDRPAALATLQRLIGLTQGHPPGTLGWRRWMFANVRAAQLLFYGGGGVRRDARRARGLIAQVGNDPAWVAEIDRSIAAEAEAARPAPTPAALPGRWSTRVWEPGDGVIDESTGCETLEDLSAVMEVGPEGEKCVWLELSRSPTRVDARWRCRSLETHANQIYHAIEETRLEVDLSTDRVEMTRTESSGDEYGPKTTVRTERGTAVRLGGC
ncbi:hypothetical protein [Arenimonas sp.]|uniref:hypothetical protein n=1 Tax=Arenimonas sp. TaxID=1872635 RepID=UPI0025C04EC9|nr:hypothetical protein [Arenimonas sp.]